MHPFRRDERESKDRAIRFAERSQHDVAHAEPAQRQSEHRCEATSPNPRRRGLAACRAKNTIHQASRAQHRDKKSVPRAGDRGVQREQPTHHEQRGIDERFGNTSFSASTDASAYRPASSTRNAGRSN